MTEDERNQMILDNTRLVTSVVKKMYLSPYAFYDKEDMYQEGIIGLMKAVDRFDPELGFAFSTYAVPLIQGEIMRFQRDYAQLLKYSRSDVDALRRITRTGKSIDELTPEELEELEITPKNMAAIRSMNATSINATMSDDSETEFGDMIADKSIKSEFSEELELEMIENIKNLVINRMKDIHQELIDEWYYSSSIGMAAGQQYLGKKYGISQGTVSRILKKFKQKFAEKLIDSGYAVPNYMIDDDE